MAFRDLMPSWHGKREVSDSSQSRDPFQSLQQDVNQAFSNFWRQFEVAPFGGQGGSLWGDGGAAPRADVVETDKAIEVSMELPGLEEEDIDVSIARGLLTVRGERKSERENREGGYYLRERQYGSFQRSIPLPPSVDPDKAEAKFKNGILHLSVPKTAEGKEDVKKISVTKG